MLPGPAFSDASRATAIWPFIADYMVHLRVERGSAANTLTSYQRDLARYACYVEQCGVQHPSGLDSGHIAQFLQILTTGGDGGTTLSERSVARMLASVRGVHRHWAQEGLTSHDPSQDVTAPKLTESLPKALSVHQVTRLLETPSTSEPLGLRDRALLEFLYATGARISEAVSLDVDDVHRLTTSAESVGPDSSEATQVVLVRVTGKGDKQRLVPLGRMAHAALGDYLTAGRPALSDAATRRSSGARRSSGPSPALFLNKLGTRLSRQSAWTVLQKTAQEAELDVEVSPHTLRHSCATHLLDGGADIRTVQELLGHASVTTTQIYTKVTAESLRAQYVTAHPRAL